jgi:N-acylneuraminate cytidylyltransferase
VPLRPTSPVRLTGLIDECIEKILAHPEADSLRIITEAPVTPYKMWVAENDDKPMKPLLSANGMHEPYNMPRQQLPRDYWQIGTLDIIRASVITEQHMMSGNTILPHIVPSWLAVDIDDLKSFEKAAVTIAQNDCIKFEN